MTYVVGDKCTNCKHTTCVDVCPVDCFHEGANMLVIDPEEYIDGGPCEPECPVSAIYSEEKLPAEQMHMMAVNSEFATRWPVITEMRDPPADAEVWEQFENKYPEHLSPVSGGPTCE